MGNERGAEPQQLVTKRRACAMPNGTPSILDNVNKSTVIHAVVIVVVVLVIYHFAFHR